MKSKTRLDSAVFQLTPTRTRCDLFIIANGKKEKIASGLLNPFVAHLKAAQDQIAEGGYSVLLEPEAGSNATWFTKSTLESFVRFVSTPEILERVYTIESEILQIEEAISIQGNTNILAKDQYIKPVTSNEGNKPACDADDHDDDDENAIVLYKPSAHERTGSSAKETNSKVELINVLETRKTVLKKEQGMAFARAVAAGFEIEHVANLLSFAECFGASRLMSGCLRFMDLWKQKHESGQWVEVEAEDAIPDAIPDCFPSEIVMANDPVAGISEPAGNNTNADVRGVEQQYHGGFPPWGVQGGVPVYPMPYYQPYPGFYPPPQPPYPSPSPVEDPYSFQGRQSMDNNTRYTNNDSEEEKHKSSRKKKSGRVVIRNINLCSSEESASSDTDTGVQQQTSLKRKGKHRGEETLKAKETGHWDAFQTCLLRSAAEGDREAMEMDPKINARQKAMAGDYDPLSAHAQNNDDRQSYDASGRKIAYSDDDFTMLARREEATVREYEEAKRNGDEAVMVSLRSTSGVNDNRDLKMFDLPENKPPHVVKYEPDALSLMPERDVEHTGHDPAIDYEMQAAALHEKTSKQDKTNKSSKPNQGMVKKGRPSMVNTNTSTNNKNKTKNTLEDARARADKLRSYKAELQKMKKEQQAAEQKRLEALKMERQKRISAKTTNSNRKQLPASSSSSKLSPISHTRGSTKFTDSEPGSSSPLQRSKIRVTPINNSKKPSTSGSSRLIDRNNSAAGSSRMTRSLPSMSDTKKETTSVADSHKASSSSIRRLSEPKKINSPPRTTNTKTRSAELVSKSKSFKKVSAAIDQSKAAELSSKLVSQKAKPSVAATSPVAKRNLNNRLSDADSSPIIDKTVVMLEHNKQLSSLTSKEFNSNRRTGMNNNEAPLPTETVDKETISVHPQKHPTTSSEVRVEEDEKKYEAPYARISSFEDQSTRNSEYTKAPNFKFGGNGTEKAYVPGFKMENIPEKPQSKGGFGFRRLLKLGKKNQTSSFDGQPSPLPKVDTLKSLISQDQTPAQAQKSSRNLFSFQFRGEKKATSFGS